MAVQWLPGRDGELARRGGQPVAKISASAIVPHNIRGSS
jgi:hypothetical protein